MEACPRWLAAVALVITTVSAQQMNLLNRGCSQYRAQDVRNFRRNLNASLGEVRAQLAGGKWFATGEEARSSEPVYAMAQCRNYLSRQDCLSCYDAAVVQIRNCSDVNGARVIFDGCFLRYESNTFYNETSLPGNGQICNNVTAPGAVAFGTTGSTFLHDLVTAAPRIKGYFAASSRAVLGGANSTIYGVVQCAETITQSGCQDCLNVAFGNINRCLPNADGRAFDAGCFLRYSNKPFFAGNQTTDIEPYLRGKRETSKNKKEVIIGSIAAGAGFILILTAILLLYKFSRKPTRAKRGNILGATQLQGPNIYHYKDLKAATKNFSDDNKLGEGAFGDVYKATLKNGHNVAVKKLDISYSRAKTDFETEVRLLSNVHHRNLVRLLGCCSKGGELLLVYEYMENGSLDKFLYGDKQGVLTWKQRFAIIFGTARGLAYLHEQYHVCIIHRDIKPSNILLDDDFQAKIADFGLARLLPENQSHVSTKFAGTLGYTAPEYAIHGHLSEKVDTYSFGIVILEIVSGRRSSDGNTEADTEYLLDEALKLYDKGMHQQLVDGALDSKEYTNEDVKELVEIALLCTQSPPSSRPTMSEIVVMLSSKTTMVDQRPLYKPRPLYGNTISDGPSISTGLPSSSSATASFS